nr:DUF2000 family protein [uncultured Faecalibaculum sp.]
MKEKCVIVTDSTLSLGLQVNAAAILGISLGARAAEPMKSTCPGRKALPDRRQESFWWDRRRKSGNSPAVCRC